MPFQKGNKGRPHGATGRLNRTVRETVLEAFTELQDDPNVNLVSWAREEPTEFYKIASKLIPTEITGSVKQIIVARIGDENDTDAGNGSDNT
jgi:hypothetical protein